MAGKLSKGRNAAFSVPHLTPAEALANITNLLRRDSEPIPDGFYSTQAIMENWKKSASQTRNIIRDAVNAGLAEMREFRVLGRKVPHYRFKRS